MNKLKNVRRPCLCCRSYNVPVGANGFCADCDNYLAKTRNEIAKLRDLFKRANAEKRDFRSGLRAERKQTRVASYTESYE